MYMFIHKHSADLNARTINNHTCPGSLFSLSSFWCGGGGKQAGLRSRMWHQRWWHPGHHRRAAGNRSRLDRSHLQGCLLPSVWRLPLQAAAVPMPGWSQDLPQRPWKNQQHAALHICGAKALGGRDEVPHLQKPKG